MFAKFLGGLNFIGRCKKYGLGLWQCPNFLFLLMGLITVVAMVGTFFVSQRFDSEGTTIMSVSFVVAFIMTLGSFVIQGVEKVAEANILKTEFISIISHQLCSPLAAIKWNMEVLELERDPENSLSEKQISFLGNIKKSNEQMLKMVTDLLEVARIDQGKAFFENKNTNIADLIKDSVKDFEPIARDKSIEVVSQIDPISREFFVDEKKMRVVVDNLIGNAIKYSNDGSKIEVRLKEKGTGVEFAVQDWGVGIPSFQHSKVFEKFFRSRNESRYRTDGVGIGLYLAKKILKKYNGSVWFESEAGRGSTFYFSLPAT